MGGVRYDHSSAGDLEWEGDDAHQGCMSWLEGWRQTHGAAAPLPMAATRAVGEAAKRLSGEGLSRIELAKLMWAAGRDGDPSPDLGATSEVVAGRAA